MRRRVALLLLGGWPTAASAQEAEAAAGWFRIERLNVFVALVLICGVILVFLRRARRDPHLKIRRIAGLTALDEAIGRATEMGRPVLFVPGVMDVDRVETIAGMAILGEVARKTAQYAIPLEVPVRYPLAMTTAQEVVRSSYAAAGRPDLFEPDRIRFITDNQFAYAAAVNGVMLRDRPAANFFLGEFYAESLVMAETGNTTGAIQIAGTAQAAQLPFFITACDYTLIGEELFAAGAYLTRAPVLLGSVKGQDYAKVIIAATIVAGVVLEVFGFTGFREFLTVR
jgi:hypothetical protein